MSTVTIASTAADASSRREGRAAPCGDGRPARPAHHVVLSAAGTDRAEAARTELARAGCATSSCRTRRRRSSTLYPAAAEIAEARLLVEAMLAEHALIHRPGRRARGRGTTQSPLPPSPGRSRPSSTATSPRRTTSSSRPSSPRRSTPWPRCSTACTSCWEGTRRPRDEADRREAGGRSPVRVRRGTTMRGSPSSTRAPSRTPSGTPRSSARSRGCAPAPGCCWSRQPRPAAAAGPARAARSRCLRRRLPRARAGAVAPAVHPPGLRRTSGLARDEVAVVLTLELEDHLLGGATPVLHHVADGVTNGEVAGVGHDLADRR